MSNDWQGKIRDILVKLTDTIGYEEREHLDNYVDAEGDIFDIVAQEKQASREEVLDEVRGWAEKEYDIEKTEFDAGSNELNEVFNDGYATAKRDLLAKLKEMRNQ